MALSYPNGRDYAQKSTKNKLGVVKLATAAEYLDAADNVAVTPAALAAGLVVQTGSVTDPSGSVTLVAGTATVLNTAIKATDKVFLQRSAVNASTTLGELTYAITAGTSLVISSAILGTPGSTQTGDLSTVQYLIVHTA